MMKQATTSLATKWRTGLITVAGVILLSVTPHAQERQPPTSPGGLSLSWRPTLYQISLTPNIETQTFHGTIKITLDSQDVSGKISFNANNLILDSIFLDDELVSVKDIAIDSANERVSIWPSSLSGAQRQLRIVYRGAINGSADGLFATRYKTEQEERVMLSTEFEPADARAVFPCWDEPFFRAPIELTVEVPSNYTAISNMPIQSDIEGAGVRSISFSRTPPIPSYIFAFCIGEFEFLEGSAEGVPLRIATTKGKSAHGALALDASARVLKYMNDYFAAPFPLPKMDQIAIPGGFNGAMENWGAITYYEPFLLFDSTKDSDRQKQTIVGYFLTHEWAHQWFGDLVTMRWWDDLWLNEAFASWFGVKTTDTLYPEWRYGVQSIDGIDRARSADARPDSHPVRQEIKSPAEAITKFDNITYQKGGAVIGMLEGYLGKDVFRDGLRLYMKSHALKSATSDDLWAALESASGKPVKQIAHSWIYQDGLPVVNVTQRRSGDSDIYTLRQSRFRIENPDAPERVWSIPLIYRGAMQESASSILMTGLTQEVKVPVSAGPVKFNLGGGGFYRVQYDSSSLAALLSNLNKFPVEDRINILHDFGALYQTDVMSVGEYLNALNRLSSDSDAFLWNSLLGAWGGIDASLQGTATRDSYRAYLRPKYARRFATLGFDEKAGEDFSVLEMRQDLIELLGQYGDSQVVAEALTRWNRYLEDQASLSPELRGALAPIVGRWCDSAVYERTRALAMIPRNTSVRSQLLGGLANSHDSALSERTLRLSLSNELPRPMTPGYIARVGYGSGRYDLAWRYAEKNVDSLFVRVTGLFQPGFFSNLFRMFPDTSNIAPALALAKVRLDAASYEEVEKDAAAKRRSVARRKREEPKILAWLTQLSAQN